jgi:hypothetical protein
MPQDTEADTTQANGWLNDYLPQGEETEVIAECARHGSYYVCVRVRNGNGSYQQEQIVASGTNADFGSVIRANHDSKPDQRRQFSDMRGAQCI